MKTLYRYVEQYETVLLWIAIAAASVLSFVLLIGQSIRLDESQTIWVATKTFTGMIGYIAEDVHVPLYFIIIHIVTQLFGTDVGVLRLVSFVFYLLTLPVLYTISKEAANKKVALLCITLFGLSPFILWYAFEVRMYTMILFFTCLSTLYYLRILRSNGTEGKFGYVIATVLGVYTHYFFSIFVASQLLYTAIETHMSVSNKGFREKCKMLFYHIALTTVAYLLFVPWVVFFISQGSGASTSPQLAPPTSYNLIQVFTNFVFGFQSTKIQPLLVSLWPLSIFIVFVLFTKKSIVPVHNKLYFFIITFIPVALAFLISYVQPIFLSRYLIFVTPSLFFLTAWILVSLFRRVTSLFVIAVICIFFTFLLQQNTAASTPVKEDYGAVTTYLEVEASAFDIIAVSAPFTIYPIEYEYDGRARIITIPVWNRYQSEGIQPYSDEGVEQQLESLEGQYDRLFLVLSYDQGYEEQLIFKMDHSYELLQKQQFSPGIQVRVYKLRYE